MIREAKNLGFISIGVSRPHKPIFFDSYCSWVAAGKYGEMGWIANHPELREDPGRLLEGCRAVITLAYPYSSKKPCTPDGLTAARYVEPRKLDYHDRLKELARRLARSIRDRHPGARTRVCVDSAPILERSFAYVSGIGFIGKNNMLIIPGHGSYLFLAEILTTASLELLQVECMENMCGSCTRCLDSCPSGALERPFFLNASRCISYLTIEYPGAVSSQTSREMGNCFFGCDICQEVCPYNDGGLSRDLSLPSSEKILNMGERDFDQRFGKTAFARPGLEKIKSNIKSIQTVAGSSRLESGLI